MNIKATYIAPKIKVHKLALNAIMEDGPGWGTSKNPLTNASGSKSSFADFGDTSDFDEAPSSSWDNSTY